MPRIRPLAPEEVGADVRATFERFLAERGTIPNMFRTLAHRPPLMTASETFLAAVMTTGTLPRLMKELVSVRVSALNDCHY